MTSLLTLGSDVLTGSVRASARLTQDALAASGRAVREVATAPRSPVRLAAPESVAGRQVWAVGGLAMVEIRGLDRAADRNSAAAAVGSALTALDGVAWARADAATGRIAVRFDARRLAVADVVAALSAAEERIRSGREGAAEPARPHTAAGPPSVHATAFAADLAGLAAATLVRFAGRPVVRPSAAALVALVEYQPWLRARVEERFGARPTQTGLAVANAAAFGLGGAVPTLLVDLARRTQGLRAERAVEVVAAQRAAELTGADRPERATPLEADERPGPLPAGPLERLVQRAAAGSAAVSGALLVATGDADLAGRSLLVGTPRVALAAREAFADTLAIALARRGVVPSDPGALQRLDRLTTAVVESAVLHDVRHLVLDARALNGWTPERVWRGAQRLLDRGPERSVTAGSPRLALVPEDDGDGGRQPAGLRRLRLLADGEPVGEVQVGAELDPLADAVLSAVREAGLRLVLTEDAAAAHLAGRADEVVPGGDPGGLRREVRRLQGAGEVVAVVGADEAALDAADVGIGVVPAAGRVPWAADLLCGPGLGEVPRLLLAASAARSVTEHGVRLALGAAFLGGLLIAVEPRRRDGRGLLAVTVAGAGALLSGAHAARAVAGRPDPRPLPHTPWHALEPDDVLTRLPDPGPPPEPVPTGSTPPLVRFGRLALDLLRTVRAELDDPLTPVLVTGAAASAVIGSPTDAALVAGVLTGSALISGGQRLRAELALRQLLADQQLTARVTGRTGAPGVTRPLPARQLRPGHVIELRAGDVVPADGRLLDEEELEVDEATLTGESTPVAKQLTATPGAELPDRACMVYEGTTVVAGAARAVVVAVGAATEAGRALALAGRAAAPSGMQHRLEELTSRGLPVTLAGGGAVTALALLRRGGLRTAVASGVAVAVAAVPEGLPLMATVAQLGAARRLSRRGVLVRASRTVEALGRVTTLCFDKTGTLTEGRLRLVRVADLGGEWSPDAPPARRVLRAAAHAGPRPAGARPLPHATDQAVLDAARAILGAQLDEDWEELAEVPFHSDRGFSATLGRTPRKVRLVVKGAPEVLLPRCSHVRDDEGKRVLDRAGRERATAAVHELAGQGLRVLAVARRNMGNEVEPMIPEDVAGIGDLTLLGFIGLADTARPEAAATIARLAEARIRPVMITGDHPVTARAIATALGIPAEPLVTGPELTGLDEHARIERVAGASVFARVSPEQKLQIVEALQRAGDVVAMAGDGANDAAAIRLADVGIGMAAKGSTSARTAADLVLTEPDISLVIDALVEGRAMWWRVRDAVAVLLGGNAGEIGFTLVGTALAGHAPIGTRQFLVVNMFTDLLPSMAVALAPTPEDAEERAALLATGRPSLGRPLLRDIAARGTVTSVGALLAWQIGRFTGRRTRAGTIALATLVGTELGQTLVVSGRNPVVLGMSLGSAAVLAAIVQTPGVSQFFGCTPLGPVAWSTVVGCSAAATLASAVLPRWFPAAAPAAA